MTVDTRYRFSFNSQSELKYGYPFEPQYTFKLGEVKIWNLDKEAARRQFQPPPGVYRARDLIAMFGPLLDTCIRRVGYDRPEKTRDVLLNGLTSILATSGRESSLPLRNLKGGSGSGDAPRDEMERQASTIGAALVRYVRESLNPDHANQNFSMISHCDGHLWTREVVGELMGPRGDSVVMQLYNEWSHRIVLLRNALMPFENWEEVPIVIPANSRGLRELQAPSEAFVMRLLSGRLPQKAVVDMAKALTAPGLPPGGFGFQYSQGTILPAFLGGSSSRSLLRYYSARESKSASDVLFDYEHESYDAAERSTLPVSTNTFTANTAQSGIVGSTLKARQPTPSRSHLKLEIVLEQHPGPVFSICLGQIARGRRYAARIPKTDSAGFPIPENTIFHKVEDALSLVGLVFSAPESESLHVFSFSDPLLGLALFGKLYPGNSVFLEAKAELASALHAGRGFGTKFVLWQR